MVNFAVEHIIHVYICSYILYGNSPCVMYPGRLESRVLRSAPEGEWGMAILRTCGAMSLDTPSVQPLGT